MSESRPAALDNMRIGDGVLKSAASLAKGATRVVADSPAPGDSSSNRCCRGGRYGLSLVHATVKGWER